MVKSRETDGKLIISLSGEINTFNAPLVEEQIQKIREAHPCDSIEIDCDQIGRAHV